jgi:hypothetical protein
MTDEEKDRRELAFTERLLQAIFGPEEMARRRAEEKQLIADFRRRARDLHGPEREREVRRYVEAIIELRVRRSPHRDPDQVRAETLRWMTESRKILASLARMRVPAIEA